MGSKKIRTKKVNNNSAAAAVPPVLINPRIYLPQVWIYRLIGNAVLLGIIFTIAFAIVTIKTNLIGKKLGDLSSEFYNYSAQLGFNTNDIIITGRHRTGKADLLREIDVDRKDNILQLDLKAIKKRLEDLPWIRRVNIRRTYFPNILQVDIQEREVKSLWQYENNFYPIDSEGKLIHADYIPTAPILLIVGDKAPQNITELLPIIQKDEEIYKRIKVANFISRRRWDIVLDDIENGITVKLPEDNVDTAWQKLIELNKSVGILKRKLTIIDLRLEGKVIIKLSKSPLENLQQLKALKEQKI